MPEFRQGPPPPKGKSPGRPKGKKYDPLMAHARQHPGEWFSQSTRKNDSGAVTQIKKSEYGEHQNGEVWDATYRKDGRPGYYRFYVCFLGTAAEQVPEVEEHTVSAREVGSLTVPGWGPPAWGG